MGNYRYILMLVIIVGYSTLSAQDQSEIELPSGVTYEQLHDEDFIPNFRSAPEDGPALGEIIIPLSVSDYKDIIMMSLMFLSVLCLKAKKTA